MAELITLEKFTAQHRRYHIYRTQSSTADKKEHYHNYYQICLVIRGELIHRQGNTAVSLCAGDAFIIPPGFIHSLHFSAAKTEIFSLSFENSLFHTGFPHSNAYRFLNELDTTLHHRQQSIPLRIGLEEHQRKSLHSLMECLIRQQNVDCPSGLSAAPSIIASILYLLAQSYYQHPCQQSQHPTAELSGCSSILSQCLEYIDSHYRDDLTLTGLSKQFGISRSSLCAAFPQFSGMPLQKYITHKRITEAQILIRSHPEMPLAQIALAVGYEDNSTFYRNFLRISGISPSKYRQLCNSASN